MNQNISSKICGSQIYTNNSIMKAQQNFTNKEINAIAQSSPIAINPANAMFFGNFKNTSQRLCGQEQANFVENLSIYEIEYNGTYFPISITIGDVLQNSTISETNLIGEKVYLSFITSNNKNASALYIINKTYTKGNMFYWVLGQDTGISNNSAITHIEVLDSNGISALELNGAIFLNGSFLLSPENILIDNGNFIAQIC